MYAVNIVGDEAGESNKLTGEDIDFGPQGAVRIDVCVSVAVHVFEDVVFFVKYKSFKMGEGVEGGRCGEVHECIG